MDSQGINEVQALDETQLVLVRLSEELRIVAAQFKNLSEERRLRGQTDATIDPVKLYGVFAWLLGDLKYAMDVEAYLCKLQKAKLLGADTTGLMQEVATVKQELDKRKKGLDWVDNLLSHTPHTGDDEV